MDERVELVSGFATPGCLGHIKSTGEKLSLRKTVAASGEFHCARPWWSMPTFEPARSAGGPARAPARVSCPHGHIDFEVRCCRRFASAWFALLATAQKHLHQASQVSALVDRPTSAQHLHILVMLSTS